MHFPAEWSPQQGIMLAWPHEQTDWSSHLNAARACVAHICDTISHHEEIYLLHAPYDHSFMTFFRSENIQMHAITPIPCQFNDTWVRDYAPISVIQHQQPHILNFKFNAWGEKYPYDLDDQLNRQLEHQNFFKATMTDMPFILEGGSIESDGCGTLLTTAQCMHQRHPNLSDVQIQQQLKQYLGVQRVLMLKHGHLIGDDTDAHIDTLARFFSPKGIVYMHCDDPHDIHYEPLRAMHEELRLLRTLEGQPYQLCPLPWPKAVLNEAGQRLATSYANFLIINDAVLLPTYGLNSDKHAQKVLAYCFPEHTIIPISCEVLIEQGGSLHCMSMQFPKGFIE